MNSPFEEARVFCDFFQRRSKQTNKKKISNPTVNISVDKRDIHYTTGTALKARRIPAGIRTRDLLLAGTTLVAIYAAPRVGWGRMASSTWR